MGEETGKVSSSLERWARSCGRLHKAYLRALEVINDPDPDGTLQVISYFICEPEAQKCEFLISCHTVS